MDEHWGCPQEILPSRLQSGCASTPQLLLHPCKEGEEGIGWWIHVVLDPLRCREPLLGSAWWCTYPLFSHVRNVVTTSWKIVCSLLHRMDMVFYPTSTLPYPFAPVPLSFNPCVFVETGFSPHESYDEWGCMEHGSSPLMLIPMRLIRCLHSTWFPFPPACLTSF